MAELWNIGQQSALEMSAAKAEVRVPASETEERLDEHGLSPLQLAAYKGNKEMVQQLLDMGADLSAGQHLYDYTALHFAALSGNSEVCRLLLEAGANPAAVNSVGRTPAQMAAFVGNHRTVAVINNFVPRKDIAYYAILQGTQTEPYIPPYIVDTLNKFVMEVNINPVRIALNLQRAPCLIDCLDKVKNVLEMLCKKEMSRGRDINEVMSFKFHYLAYTVGEIHKIIEKQAKSKKDGDKEEEKDEKKHDVIELFCKKLLKPGKDGSTLDFMEGFLKECVREFPFRECSVFHQMITVLTSKDPPSALSVVNSAINGQRGFVDSVPCCDTCGEEKPAKKCSKCKYVQYCDRECQRLHWFVHKKACSRLAAGLAHSPDGRPRVDEAELSAGLQNLITG